jgi:REP element-mobilizing transposase RayT
MRENTSGDGIEGVASAPLIEKRRNLPHWEMGGATYFVTFRLYGLPGKVALLTPWERAIIAEGILFWHPVKWHVHMFTVMPDHVHLLATPCEEKPGRWYALSRILHSVKSYTANAINQHRAMQGRLWQSESFDRIVRDAAEFDEKATYIFNNAVKANLATDGWRYDGFWYSMDDA